MANVRAYRLCANQQSESIVLSAKKYIIRVGWNNVNQQDGGNPLGNLSNPWQINVNGITFMMFYYLLAGTFAAEFVALPTNDYQINIDNPDGTETKFDAQINYTEDLSTLPTPTVQNYLDAFAVHIIAID